MNKKDSHDLYDIILRYLLILILGLGNLVVFYEIFRPVTIGLVHWIVSLFTFAHLTGTTMFVNGVFFEFVNACIGGSAYYLLFILVMSTRGILLNKRLKVLFFTFLFLYLFNVLRILLMIGIVQYVYFDAIHWFFWYFISTIFVILDWILVARYFKVKEIPVYSDVLFLGNAMIEVPNSKPDTKSKKNSSSKKSKKKSTLKKKVVKGKNSKK